jgi:hypothetical protein
MRKVTIDEAGDLLKQQDIRLSKQRFSMVRNKLEDILWMIEPSSLAEKYVHLYEAYPTFATNPAGMKHHHWWTGGLSEHVKEMIGLGFDLHDLYSGDLPFTKSDIIITCFLHDFAKVWSFVPLSEEDRKDPRTKPNQQFKGNRDCFKKVDDETKTLLTLAAAGIVPTENQWSAVLFAEGGYAKANFNYQGRTDTGNSVFGHNPLAAFLHILDLYSSQILGKSLYASSSEESKALPENGEESIAASAEVTA